MKTKLLTFTLMTAALASASTIQFIGPVTSVNDGADYVGPYAFKVDGIDMTGICINSNINVGPPFTWDATLEPLNFFPQSQQTLLLEADYLALQFAVNSDWVGLHHAIWDLFGASYPGTSAWIQAAQDHYGQVDPSTFQVLVPNPVSAAQSFIVQVTPTEAPEVETSFLLLAGLSLIFLSRQLKRRKLP
jgi:hypothetical protein